MAVQNFMQFKKTMARLDAQLKKEEALRKAKKEAKAKEKKEKKEK
jgi:hypothetical protein